MKKTFHLCLSGKNEVLFRRDSDFIRAVNCLYFAGLKTSTTILAYVFMSNHVHICVRTESARKFMKAFMYPYNRYFNNKYHRKGKLGEDKFYELEIEGLHHLLTAIAYILRNPLHHAVCATPFGYRYSSISALFKNEMGRFDSTALMPKRSQHKFLPDGAKLPDGILMDCNGMILPECIVDVADIQHQFSTPRTFLYYMNRLSGETWEKEQLQDNNSRPPITLSDIEICAPHMDIKSLLANEHGRANYHRLSDTEICVLIDTSTKERTIYDLTSQELERLASHIQQKYKIPKEQLIRCFGGRLTQYHHHTNS